MGKNIIAYKGFDKNLQCRKFQYEVGKEYKIDGDIALYQTGFHFCKRLQDVHSYYNLKDSRICEVEAIGKVIDEGEKSVTDHIKIIRELTREEILYLSNTGRDNTGLCNSGDRNSGDSNSGYSNSGDRNSGDRNSGDRNSGDSNSGDSNSGYSNSGYSNSGDSNSGDSNSGDFCSCNNSAGLFMSERISYEAFNKSISESEFNKLINSEGYQLCFNFYLIKYRVRTVTGKFGDYRYMSYKNSWRVFWNKLTLKEKQAIKTMPHFDKVVFEEITGVKT